MREIVYCETPEDVADAAADLIFESQSAAISERGIFRIALSGGRTPRPLYRRLASEEWKNVMAWDGWEVFWSDERAVPPDHPESNFALAQRELLSKVPVQDVWRMPADLPDLCEAAEDYARTLKSRFGPGAPVFDSILLGMGADGHTASLFPGSAALESGALVEAVEVPHAIPRRLTFTLRLLNSARQVIFLVTGSDKAEAVRAVLDANDYRLPAARVDPRDGTCWWLLDAAAAALIR